MDELYIVTDYTYENILSIGHTAVVLPEKIFDELTASGKITDAELLILLSVDEFEAKFDINNISYISIPTISRFNYIESICRKDLKLIPINIIDIEEGE